MATLKFKSRKAEAGTGMFSSTTTHDTNLAEKLPEHQYEGVELVHFKMQELLPELDKLGYDTTTAIFSIKTK
jgi:hypothetical protein